MSAHTRVLLALVAASLLIVALWSVQPRLTYLPAGRPPSIAQVLPEASAVTLSTHDELELDAWWLPVGPTVVMVLPGNAGNRAGRAPLATALGSAGLSVLLVEYRGYGGNPGEPSQEGLLADADAAARWLSERSDVDDVVYLGESLGAAVALGLAGEVAPAAVVLRSPFTSLGDVARSHYGPVPDWMLRDRFPAQEWLAGLRAPLLVVAGAADEVVPARLSRRLFETARHPKTLVMLPGAGHNDRALLDGDVYVDAITSFLIAQGLLD